MRLSAPRRDRATHARLHLPLPVVTRHHDRPFRSSAPRAALPLAAIPLAAILLATWSACGGEPGAPDANAASAGRRRVETSAPLRIALAPCPGEANIDDSIRRAQDVVREHADVPRLERLASLFVNKARSSGDPGYYKQAEACADAMLALDGGDCAALLVRGHVRHALHDFRGAENLARQLVARRDLFLDHGLLGDVLLDQGDVAAARDAYARMMELRPCLQSYARAAQIRWLAGDIDGARELLALAADSGSRRDPESLAWVLVRRATLELQVGACDVATQHAARALELVPGYPPALLARGRAALARGDHQAATRDLAAAASASPLPEHQWAALDAERAAGATTNAEAIEARLLATGAVEDPRTFVLWLATVDRDHDRALQLARREHALRQDVYTLDALAFAQWRSGDWASARETIAAALADGLRDARVSLHAALIAADGGDRAAAAAHAEAATAGRSALLPSECTLLDALLRRS